MIVAAAIIYDGVVWTLPRPARHGDIIEQHFRETGITGSGSQGFVDDRGAFMDRMEAGRHVIACGQPLRVHERDGYVFKGGRLFSEDLW